MTRFSRRVVNLFVLSGAVGLVVALLTGPTDERLTTSPVNAPAPAGSTTTSAPPAPVTGTAVPSVPATPTAPPTIATTSTTSTTIAPTTTRDPNAPRAVSMLFTGDILAENPVLTAGERAAASTGARYDFRLLFAPITPLVHSFDLAVCQMEIPVGRPDEAPGSQGRSPFGGNLLLGPYELVPALKAAGFDRCTTASNHSYDTGDAGVVSTIDAMEENGISWSGTARTPDEDPAPVFDVAGTSVAHLSYTRYSNTTLPPDEWRVAFTANPARVASEVTEARAAGADLVVVSIHLAQELKTEPLPEDRAFAEAVVASADVDAIVHHGPHVVQGFEVIGDTPVWWTIGNFLSGMARPNASDRYTDPRTRDGLGAVLRFTESEPGGDWDVEASSIVLCNESSSRIIHAGVTALADPSLTPAIREELAGCVERTRAAVPEAG